MSASVSWFAKFCRRHSWENTWKNELLQHGGHSCPAASFTCLICKCSEQSGLSIDSVDAELQQTFPALSGSGLNGSKITIPMD